MSDTFDVKNPPPPKPVKRWVVLDKDGAPQSFYSDDVWDAKKIPDIAVEINDAQYSALLEGNSFARLKNGKVTHLEKPKPQPPPPNPFDEIKALLVDFGARIAKLENR